MDPALSIPAFYSRRSVFITGATGFLGKALIEKLLRSCPDIGELFLLIRAKKGTSAKERLCQLLTNPLFDILREKQPHCFDKLIPVEGDIGLEGLGLSIADRDMLIEKTSVIFHIAAIVKFDSTFKETILKNVRSTRDICILGERMKGLTALVHVSSAYAQSDKYIIEELAYPITLDWKKTIQVAETLDSDILEVLKAKYIGSLPNQYIFSKKIAEQVIIDYSKSLPCVISRPSLVMGSIKDPLKGWVDNFNGPVGLCTAYAKGIYKVGLIDSNLHNDQIPVDIVIKTFIVMAWKRGAKMTTRDSLPPVYNCVSRSCMHRSHTELCHIGDDILTRIPFENILWTPGVIYIKSLFLYRLLVLLLHVIPSLFIDGWLQLSGRQPRLMKIYRQITRASVVLTYFVTNVWEIRNKNMLRLSDEIPIDDQQDFGFAADTIYDIYKYWETYVIGIKVYLLNESMDRLDAARSHSKRIIWIGRIVKTLISILFMWIVYKIIV